MNRIMRIFNKNVMGIIFIILISSSIGVYAATTYSSNLILYKSSDGNKNLNTVLDELYELQNSTSKSNVYLLGTGNSQTTKTFNLSNLPNYKEFTVRNFYFKDISQQYQVGSGISNSEIIKLSYDNNTGILTVGTSSSWGGSYRFNFNYSIYCIYSKSKPNGLTYIGRYSSSKNNNINISDFKNYKKITSDNFYFRNPSQLYTSTLPHNGAKMTISYDNDLGVINIPSSTSFADSYGFYIEYDLYCDC